jgi:catechol 2,3-dioxygenase-like lactoylglutathione lyase family enzyme
VPGVRGLDHTSFTVSSIDRSRAFYCDLLGCELLSHEERKDDWVATIFGYEEGRIRVASLRSPGSEHLIELIEFLAPSSAAAPIEPRLVGAGHLCFLVDDLDAEYRRLRAAGVDSFVSPPVEGKRPGGGRWTALFLRDPDGILVELYRPALRP